MRAAVYFALVFGAGFVFGVVRVLMLEPRLGERWSELAEMPLMLFVTVAAARFVLRRYPAAKRANYLASGVLALLFMLAVEFSVVLSIRGLSIAQYFAERDPVAGTVYALMLLVFALMPWILGKKIAADAGR